jgi:hypothetical protein
VSRKPIALAPLSEAVDCSAAVTATAGPPKSPVINRSRRQATLVLLLLLGGFIALQALLPLGKVVKIGADEDLELSKPTLCLHGYKLYTQIWNDQPPLYTFLLTNILQYVSASIVWLRLLTVAFATLLLCAVFLLAFRIHGLLTATLALTFLIASPGFIELSCSCMQEIPALAPLAASICVLLIRPLRRRGATEIISGFLFAVALELKFIGIIYGPIFLIVIWFGRGSSGISIREAVRSLLVLATSTAVAFVALNYMTGSPLLLQIKQSWASHFAAAKAFEYGSPGEHPFDWSLLLKNWDMTVPALVGVAILVREMIAGKSRIALLPIFWLLLTLLVFARHKPWWEYYYLHNAVPICWLAAVGFSGVWKHLRSSADKMVTGRAMPKRLGTYIQRTTFALFFGASLCWMGARVYGEQADIRASARLHSSYVLKEIQRFKPFTTFMFADRPIFSFHSDIPLPPHLAMLSLKRFWTGDMSNARLVAELEAAQPELILWTNDSREVPFQDLLTRNYQLAYIDAANRLFVHKNIVKQVRRF